MAVEVEPDLSSIGVELLRIDEQLTPLSIWNAIATYRAAARARSELDALAAGYYREARQLQNALVPFSASGPMHALGGVLGVSGSTGLSNILAVQQRWANVNGLVDRKQSLALGAIGLFIAVIALIVSMIPFVAS